MFKNTIYLPKIENGRLQDGKNKTGGEIKMELEVKKSISIPDGTHQGIIIETEYKDTPYEYTDLIIEMEEMEEFDGLKLKAGYPTLVMLNSKLGKLLARFGADLVEGGKVDVEKTLIGRKCEFLTMTESTPRGSFARVIPASVKPSPKTAEFTTKET